MKRTKYTTVRVRKDAEMEKILRFYKDKGITLTSLTTALLKEFYRLNKGSNELKLLKQHLKQI